MGVEPARERATFSRIESKAVWAAEPGSSPSRALRSEASMSAGRSVDARRISSIKWGTRFSMCLLQDEPIGALQSTRNIARAASRVNELWQHAPLHGAMFDRAPLRLI